MVRASREFQVFVKPAGAACNLACSYCYYLEKAELYPDAGAVHMPDDVLERYVEQQIEAYPGDPIPFSWHGGEPTVLGLDYFRRIVELQRKHRPRDRRVVNGMQTNGTLLDEGWCRFLAEQGFAVGLSLDGPRELHDRYRLTRSGASSFEQTMRGYGLLRDHGIACDMLCVVNDCNVRQPLEVYRFFKEIGAVYITFLPLVERETGGVSGRTVPAEAWGEFLCTVFDEWLEEDIGRVRVQIFEEAARTAFEQEHSLCIFREECGNVPVVERNGDFYSCDHFVDAEHLQGNIMDTHLAELLESEAQREFGRAKRDALPRYCLECEVLAMCNGECPKNRFEITPDGEAGLNFLCPGYKRFFTHCKPFVEQVAALHRSPSAEDLKRHAPKVGRNDPCPCGSGRKYKKCCMGK